MLSLCVIAILAQQAGAAPNVSRQGPLLVAEEVFTASVMSVEDGDSVVGVAKLAEREEENGDSGEEGPAPDTGAGTEPE